MIHLSQQFADLKKALLAGGSDQLHVISDFDRTLTTAYVNGQETGSLISILRDKNYLTPDYPDKAKALAAHYRPLENDQNISLTERQAAMQEWWSKHFELLIASRLNKRDIERAMGEESVVLRPGADSLLHGLADKKIPLVILSSGGLGEESIAWFLQKRHLLLPNLHIVSNAFVWAENGTAVAVRQPIIHSLNKNETILTAYPFYQDIIARPNIILLGDSLSDIGMAEGLAHKTIIKIGLWNKDDNPDPAFLIAYDVVISGDSNLDFVSELIDELN